MSPGLYGTVLVLYRTRRLYCIVRTVLYRTGTVRDILHFFFLQFARG